MEIFTTVLMVILGGGLLVAGGEILVRGATKFSLILHIPQLVVGLTIVAACTGAPELTVSLMSCIKENGSPDLALGNVVGSGICNILLILGVASLIRPMSVSTKLIRREMPIMILVSLLLWGVIAISTGREGNILPHWSGFIFFALFIAYSYWTVREIKKQGNETVSTELQDAVPDVKEPVFKGIVISLLMITVGMGLLIFGSDLFIDGAVAIATMCGVSKLIIGLTVLAVGTSLPELVVSVVAAVRGKADLAIGNVVGSNIFNILVVLGLSSIFVREGIAVSHQALCFDLPVLVATALIGTYFCTTGKRLARGEGAMFLLCYFVYIASLFFLGPGL